MRHAFPSFLFMALPLLAASCKGTNSGRQSAAADTTVVASDTAEMPSAEAEAAEPDSLFFPKPDKAERAYNDYEDYPAYFAFVGRFASFDDMRRSPFYEYLCQRIPELAGVKKFAVNTTDGPDDVWMLIPRAKGIMCTVKKFYPEMISSPNPLEFIENAPSYYKSQNMEPLLIHTSMDGEGSVLIDVSAVSAVNYEGENRFLWVVPRHESASNDLTFTPVGKGDFYNEPFVVPALSGLAVISGKDEWWRSETTKAALMFMANGLVLVRDGRGKVTSCSCLSYMHKGRPVMAVKSDDGTRRAVWLWDTEWEYREGGGDGKLTLRQIKGNLLPDNKEHEWIKED